jgi:hypothetical protein
MKETLVCLKEQSSRRVVATFLEIVRICKTCSRCRGTKVASC